VVIYTRSVVERAGSGARRNRARTKEYAGQGCALDDRADPRCSCSHAKGDSGAYLWDPLLASPGQYNDRICTSCRSRVSGNPPSDLVSATAMAHLPDPPGDHPSRASSTDDDLASARE
jgi:hypothetical protein